VIGYFGFLDLGLSRVFARRIAQARDPASMAEEVGLLSVMARRLFGLACAVAIVLFMAIPTHWLAGVGASESFTAEVRWSWLILAATIPAVTVSNLWRGAMEGREAFDVVNLYRVVFGSWTFAAPLAALAWTDHLPALVLAMALGRWLGAACHWQWCLRHLPRSAGTVHANAGQVVRAALIEGGWISVSSGLGPLMSFIDRFVLAGLLPLATVAVYSVPQDIALRMLFIPGAFALALFPRLAALAVGSEAGAGARIAEKAARMSLAMALPVCIAAGLMARPALMFWLGGQFAPLGAPVLQWLMIGVVVSSPAQIAFTKLQAVGRARSAALLHLAEVVPYCGVLWLVARRFGVMGAAVVWTARVVIDAALMIVLMRRIDPRSFGSRTLLAMLMAIAALLVVVVIGDAGGTWGWPQLMIVAIGAATMFFILSPAEWRETAVVLRQFVVAFRRR